MEQCLWIVREHPNGKRVTVHDGDSQAARVNEQLERMVEEARNGRTEWAWQAALADSGPAGSEEG